MTITWNLTITYNASITSETFIRHNMPAADARQMNFLMHLNYLLLGFNELWDFNTQCKYAQVNDSVLSEIT